MQESFQDYFNHTIYPELYRKERERRRLLGSMVAIGVLLAVSAYLMVRVGGLFGLVIFAFPGMMYFVWAGAKYQQYIKRFKPDIVNLILDHIDDKVSFGTLHYDPDRGIPKSDFIKSGLFVTKADYYEAEDYISGIIGDVSFEFCEVRVAEFAGPQAGMRPVASGIFLKAEFGALKALEARRQRQMQDAAGSTSSREIPPADEKKPQRERSLIFIVPKDARAAMTRAIKRFHLQGAEPVTVTDEPDFDKYFTVYRARRAPVSMKVSAALSRRIFHFAEKMGHKPAILITNTGARALLPFEKDLLEPGYIFTRMTYEQIEKFYRDLQVIFGLIEELDRMF